MILRQSILGSGRMPVLLTVLTTLVPALAVLPARVRAAAPATPASGDPARSERTVASGTVAAPAVAAKSGIPNVLVILTDDQGFGDLSCHGNTIFKTPHLDKLAASSVRLRQFHVSPVCAPTRASLMTGRWNYRTGAVDTYLGRAMMFPDEVTLAEVLGPAGRRCGLFGKWHLGDCAPMRPQDQGFHEVLMHRGGGISQPSDPPGGESYFDPVLEQDGKLVKTKGYCTDVFADAAIKFIESRKGAPFFAWVAFNAPHGPLQVAPELVKPYEGADWKSIPTPAGGRPVEGNISAVETAKIAAMVANIDDNVGRLLATLDRLGLKDDTVVVFITDNGPQQPRYNAGMRGRKGSVYEGGTRVPCFVRLPGQPAGGRDVDFPAAHVDLMPTLLAACGVDVPAGRKLDGINLLPMMQGKAVELVQRSLFIQWHRGDVPQPRRAAAVREGRWKLVLHDGPGSFDEGSPAPKKAGKKGGGAGAGPELFDLAADPSESVNLADKEPAILARMTAAYDAWYAEMKAERGFALPRIVLDHPGVEETNLTRQDWRGPEAGWTAASIGIWECTTKAEGRYDLTVTAPGTAATVERTVSMNIGNTVLTATLPAGSTTVTFAGVTVPAGDVDIGVRIRRPGADTEAKPAEPKGNTADPKAKAAAPAVVGARYIDIRRAK